MNDFYNALADFDDPLRQLYMLAVEPDLSVEDKIAKLLQLGTEALDLELGIVSRVDHPRSMNASMSMGPIGHPPPAAPSTSMAPIACIRWATTM
ncbi:hypothetical protein [Sulfitobacter sp. CS16]|uniref:hypothetical protein n=1 Tax=Sulfitobacter sp. CS16 TaxID=3368573 RepID=UPI003746DFD5